MNSQLYESLYKNIKIPYLLLEKQNNKLIVLDVNNAFEEYFLLKKEEVIHKNCSDIFGFEEIETEKYYYYNNKYFFINSFEASEEALFFEFIDKTKEIELIKGQNKMLGPLNDIILEFNEDFSLAKARGNGDSKLIKILRRSIGRKATELYIPEVTNHFVESLKKAKNTAKLVTIEYDLKVASVSRWYQIDIEYISKTKKYVVIIKDINDLKEKELKIKMDKEERENEKKLRNIVFDLSMDLMLSKKSEIDKTINYSLKKLGKHIKADRAYIVEYFCEDGGKPKNTYEWVEEGITSEIEIFQTIDDDIIKLWDNFYDKNEILYIPNTNILKDSKLKNFLINRNIKSLISLPMMYKGECRGILGFEYVKSYQEFSETEKAIFTEFSGMLIGAFNMNYYEKALSDSEYKYRQITDNMNDVVWVVDARSGITFINPSIYELTGYTADEYMKIPKEKKFTKESVKKVDELLKKNLINSEKIKQEKNKPLKLNLLEKMVQLYGLNILLNS